MSCLKIQQMTDENRDDVKDLNTNRGRVCI